MVTLPYKEDRMSLAALIYALLTLHESLDLDVAREHVEAAQQAAQSTGLDVDLLLGIAAVESDYDGDSLSYRYCKGKEECVRRTGIWRSDSRPPHSRPSWYCGAMQVGGWVPWEECQTLRMDTYLNYQTGAEHLVDWMKDPYCRYKKTDAKLVCALQGYNGGYAAIKGDVQGYARKVLWEAQKIRKLAERAPNT